MSLAGFQDTQLTYKNVFLETESHYHLGWSAIEKSWFTAASASWVQAILLSQPQK